MDFKFIKEYPRFYIGICKHGYKECFSKNEYIQFEGKIKKHKILYDPNEQFKNIKITAGKSNNKEN